CTHVTGAYKPLWAYQGRLLLPGGIERTRQNEAGILSATIRYTLKKDFKKITAFSAKITAK
ncbi:MAG: hypothetical protein WDA65_09415, partial [Christensenellales bacterium]